MLDVKHMSNPTEFKVKCLQILVQLGLKTCLQLYFESMSCLLLSSVIQPVLQTFKHVENK